MLSGGRGVRKTRNLLRVIANPADAATFGCTGDSARWIPRESLLAATAVVEDGAQDTENRHISTVRIILNEPLLESQNARRRHNFHDCSGVLIKPNLVLTAGHCVCKLRHRRTDPALNAELVTLDSSACVKDITIIKSIYHPGNQDNEPGWTTSEYKAAAVKPHPRLKAEYRLQLNGNRIQLSTLSSEADLAVIVLQRAITGAPVFELGRTEVQSKKDEIIMVGYGPTTDGGMSGTRHYGDNRVEGFIAPPTRSDIVVFAVGQPRAHVLGGDSGGPCFRNSATGSLELVGIASERVTHKDGRTLSLFTSTHSTKAWLDKVKNEAD